MESCQACYLAKRHEIKNILMREEEEIQDTLFMSIEHAYIMIIIQFYLVTCWSDLWSFLYSLIKLVHGCLC